jgi:hypothetical protein
VPVGPSCNETGHAVPVACYKGCMASGPLSCHTGADGFGDGESLLGGDGVGDGALLSGGDGLGDGEALYDGNGVGDGVSTPCPKATPVPTPAMANIATPASKVIFARLIMDTPWPSGPLPHPSRHTSRHKASLALLTDMFQGVPQLCGTANRKQRAVAGSLLLHDRPLPNSLAPLRERRAVLASNSTERECPQGPVLPSATGDYAQRQHSVTALCVAELASKSLLANGQADC